MALSPYIRELLTRELDTARNTVAALRTAVEQQEALLSQKQEQLDAALACVADLEASLADEEAEG